MPNYNSIHTGLAIDNVVSNALLKNEAASIYITQTNAAALYPTKQGGGASGTWNINISGTARYMTCPDTRSTNPAPGDYTATTSGVSFDFKQGSVISLTDASYSGVMTYRPYASAQDWSGGNAHQIAFNNAGLYWRKGSSSWGSWVKILNNSNGCTLDTIQTISATKSIQYNQKIIFNGANSNTSPCAQIGYLSELSGGKMHCYNNDNSYQTSGAFYIWSNGCDAGNDNGGIAIDNEGVTVFGAGDTGTNFTGIFRVINEDDISAGPVFLVRKTGETIIKGNLVCGNRESSSTPSSLTSVTRMTITPYFHTGGPWYIKSEDDNTNAHLSLYYGSTNVMKIRHDSHLMNILKITCNGNTFFVGSQNTSWNHLYNSANIPFIFNNTVCTTTGDLGHTSYPFNNVIINGSVQKPSNSQAWVNGRNGAAVRNRNSFTANWYNPIVSCKTINGTIDLGTYTSNNSFYITYITDANYNAGTNSATAQWEFRSSNGYAYGKSWATSSDIRRKENIHSLPNNIDDFVLNLQPKIFNWKDDTEKKETFGFIAQEVKNLMEDYDLNSSNCGLLTQTSEEEDENNLEPGYYSLSYQEFIPMLTHLCQTQQKQINLLQKEIQELKGGLIHG